MTNGLGTCVFLWAGLWAANAAEPDARAPQHAASGWRTLQRIRELNPHLDAGDPLALPMKVSALMLDEYSFFRGTADLFYEWCGTGCSDWLSEPEAQLTLHGDVHLGNLGTYRAADGAQRRICFGLVDFDEAVRGPYALDLLRAATALRCNAPAATPPADEALRAAIERMYQAYLAALEGDLTPPHIERHPAVARVLAKARRRCAAEYLEGFVLDTPAGLRFRDRRGSGAQVKDIMLPVDEPTRHEIAAALWAYVERHNHCGSQAQYVFAGAAELNAALLDVVRWVRLGSSGSQGLKKYLVVLRRPLRGVEEDVILQLKAEPEPAAQRAGMLEADAGSSRAAQVARDASTLSDPPAWLMGWVVVGDGDYLVKAKDAWSVDLEPAEFSGGAGMSAAAYLLGATVGLAHRNALRGAPDERRFLERAALRRPALVEELFQRSAQVHAHLARAFQDLCADPIARALAAQALEQQRP